MVPMSRVSRIERREADFHHFGLRDCEPVEVLLPLASGQLVVDHEVAFGPELVAPPDHDLTVNQTLVDPVEHDRHGTPLTPRTSGP
jgi:hypothetical protein